MSQTQQQAVDEILERFNSVWGPTGYAVVWPDVPIEPSLQKMIDGADGVVLAPYARVTVRSNTRKQKTLGQSTRIYTSMGVIFIEIFTPTGDGMVAAYALAEDMREAYEVPNVSSYHVWYGEVKVAENGSEGLWSRLTVTAEWQYEQVR
jgi:hypothetical protein